MTKRAKKVWIAIVSTGLLVVLTSVILTAKAGADVKELADNAKIPPTADGLYKSDIPDADNAALVLNELSEAVEKQPSQKDRIFPESSWRSKRLELRQESEARPLVISAALKMASMSAWKPRVREFGDIDFRDFAALKEAVKTLCVQSRSRALEADLNGCADDIIAACKISDLVSQDSTLIGLLVDVAVRAIVVKSAVETSPYLRSDASAFGRMQRAIASLKEPTIAAALEGEAFHYRQLFLGQPMNFDQVSFDEPAKPEPSILNNIRQKILVALAGPSVMRFWADYLPLLRSKPQDLDAAATSLGSASGRFEKYASPTAKALIFDDTYLQAIEAVRKSRAWMDIAVVGLEAVKAGALPNVSNSKDPFSSGNLKVVGDKDAWKIYSIGLDRHDDGGATLTQLSKAKAPSDIVFEWDGKDASLKGR